MPTPPPAPVPPDVEWYPLAREMKSQNVGVYGVLRDIPLFQGLSGRDWRELDLLVHERKYNPGETIFEAGMPGLGMYVIIAGSVRIVERIGGTEVEIARLEAGDFFGEMSLIEETIRSASAIAEGKTHLAGIFRPQLHELMRRRLKFGLLLMERLACLISARLREANRRLTEYRRMQMEEC